MHLNGLSEEPLACPVDKPSQRTFRYSRLASSWRIFACFAIAVSSLCGLSKAWGQVVLAQIAPVAQIAAEASEDANDSPDTGDLEATKTVGPVRVTTLLSPASPQIGDEVTLEIRVEAEAEVEVLMPEFGESLDSYKIVDYVPRESIATDGTSTQIQRYTLQPMLSGDQTILPILIEFVDNRPGKAKSPDDFDAYEILTDRIEFTVRSMMLDNDSLDLKPPMGELAPIETASPYQSIMPWLLAAGGLLIVVLSAVAFWLSRSTKQLKVDAYEVAKLRIDQLLQRWNSPESMSAEDYFVEISAIIRQYLEDRFEIRAPELTTEEFLELAANGQQLTRDQQRALQEFLRKADMVKFAGVRATHEEVQQASRIANHFIEETRPSSLGSSQGSQISESPGLRSTNASAASTEEGQRQ